MEEKMMKTKPKKESAIDLGKIFKDLLKHKNCAACRLCFGCHICAESPQLL